jgi:hypothetical protein
MERAKDMTMPPPAESPRDIPPAAVFLASGDAAWITG